LRELVVIPIWVLALFFVMVGLVIGSFINVVAHRVPLGLSVVSPRSRCPSCETPIGALDNIPVVSWILLRGKCRSCSTPISARYPATEALCALLFVLVFHKVSVFLPEQLPEFFVGSLHGTVFLSLLLAVTLIDLDHFIIPDMLSLPGCIVGLVFAFAAPRAVGVTWQEAGVGAVAGSGFLLLIAVGYAAVRGREGMGMGDVKLMTTIGAFLGVYSIPFVIFAAALQGSVLAVLWILISGGGDGGEVDAPEVEASDASPEEAVEGEEGLDSEAQPEGVGAIQVPFGPFLALGAVEWYLFSEYLSGFFPLY